MATLAAALPETAPQTRILGASFSWWLLIAPAVILMLAFYAFPLAEVLWISFTEPEPANVAAMPLPVDCAIAALSAPLTV